MVLARGGATCVFWCFCWVVAHQMVSFSVCKKLMRSCSSMSFKRCAFWLAQKTVLKSKNTKNTDLQVMSTSIASQSGALGIIILFAQSV